MSAISVENYKNNEQIFHPIVLIKGRISNHEQSHSEIRVISLTNSGNFRLSKKGQFKVVLELIPGDNLIQFSYNGAELELTLHFTEQKLSRKVQPVYLLCRDTTCSREKIEIDCQKVLLGCKLAQTLYSEKLFEGTSARRTFFLADSCKSFTLNITEAIAHALSDQELWQIVAKSLIESRYWDTSNTKFVAFCSFTKYLGLSSNTEYTYAQIRAQTLSNPALSSGGLALLGTGCLYTWPANVLKVIECFSDKTPVDIATELDDSNYRCTRGGCFSTTIGSVCHELGHIFDLGHTKDGIMGKDIDYVGRVFVTELHTENLPDRIVGVRPQKASQQEKKSRFTKINRTPGQFLIKYHEQKDDDLSFFAQNNLIALAFHKWFATGIDAQENDKIKFEDNTVKSDFQIILVELRKSADEMLLQFWNLTETDIYEFKLPQECDIEETVLFVMDIEGNILKQKL